MFFHGVSPEELLGGAERPRGSGARGGQTARRGSGVGWGGGGGVCACSQVLPAFPCCSQSPRAGRLGLDVSFVPAGGEGTPPPRTPPFKFLLLWSGRPGWTWLFR